MVGLRSSGHAIGDNRELYELGGGPKGFSRFSCALGALQLPMPAFELDMQSKAVGRSFSDWLSCIQIPKKTKQIWYQRKLLRELTRENY